MNRTPPAVVRQALRREVGFGCPVEGCGNPYLEYHHFDPPWSEAEHHNPDGMIALCIYHHPKADGGSYTKEQLRDLKRATRATVVGRFDWMRNRLLTVVGGNLYYENPVAIQFRGEDQIWFNRDEENHMLLNLRMVTASGLNRLRLEDNDWTLLGDPVDFESPPSGKRIRARYKDGDELGIEFFEVLSPDAAAQRYPHFLPRFWSSIEFPVTTVEIQEVIGGTSYQFGPTSSTLPGVTMTGCFSHNSPVGFAWTGPGNLRLGA